MELKTSRCFFFFLSGYLPLLGSDFLCSEFSLWLLEKGAWKRRTHFTVLLELNWGKITGKRELSVAGVPSLCGPPNWMWRSANTCQQRKLPQTCSLFETFTKIADYALLPLCSSPRNILDVASLPRQVINSFVLTLICWHVRFLKLKSMLPETRLLGC